MPARRATKACAPPAVRVTRGPDHFGHLLDKTRLCKFFFEGKCQRGRSCTFAHSEAELLAQPDLYRSQLCMEFAQTGTCRYGESCRFAHGIDQLRTQQWNQELAGVEGPAQGDYLKQKLAEMKMQTRALEAQLEAIEGGAADTVPPPPAPWPCEGAAWALHSYWAAPPSQESAEDEAGSCQSWDDRCPWTAYPVCEMWPVVFTQQLPAQPPSPPQHDCDGASQRSTDCDGTSSQHAGTDTEADDACNNAPAAAEPDVPLVEVREEHEPTQLESSAPQEESEPHVVVKNTFIEYEVSPAEPPRRRSKSVPPAGAEE